MKKFLLLLSLIMASAAFCAEKLNWESAYKDGQAKALKEKKNMLVIFSGSDWCPPCMRMEKDLLNDKDFIKFANKTFVLYHADLPRRKPYPVETRKLNNELFNKYGEGYVPYLVILSPDGQKLGSTGYSGKTNQMIKSLEKLNKTAEKKQP